MLHWHAWYEHSSRCVSWMQPSRARTLPYVSESKTLSNGESLRSKKPQEAVSVAAHQHVLEVRPLFEQHLLHLQAEGLARPLRTYFAEPGGK